MPQETNARLDDTLTARIINSTELQYEDDSDSNVERPPHVRAASSLAPFFENHFAVIQDDVNFLALVDRDTHRVWSHPLPKGPGDTRTYGEGESDTKLDLEACLTVPGTNNRFLLAMGSGDGDSREWIVTVSWPEDADEPDTNLIDPDRFYSSLRQTHAFAGAGLNIEGAVFVDDDTIRLFQRGNAEPHDDLQPVDATGDISWEALKTYLEDPEHAALPEVTNIVQYEIGTLDDVRLTFSDAEITGDAILFSASAEASDDTDYVAGSVLGVMDEKGARWTPVTTEDGDSFGGKMEGLSVDADDLMHVFFVIDSDDESQPSKFFEVELKGPWYE